MRILILLSICMLLSSCSSGNKKQFQRLYYRFPEPKTMQIPMALDIQKPTALGIFANRPLVAVDSTGALKQMNYSFWLESPKVLLNNYLNTMLVSENENTDKSYELQTQILQFEKQVNLAKVKIQFKLFNNEGNLIQEKTYENQLQASDKSVGQFVKNIGLILEQISSELVKDLL